MKICKICGVEKEETEFYLHPAMANGRINQCKECVKARVRERYKNKKVAIQRYERMRNQRPERKAYALESQRKHRAKYKDKYKARMAVNNAIRSGNLIKGPCCKCGSMYSEAHHDDYSKPLEVKWYCRQCHPITK